MRSGTIAFLAGAMLCHRLSDLPPAGPLAGLGVLVLVLGVWGLRWVPARLTALAALGLLWTAGTAHLALIDRFPAHLEHRDLALIGTVVSVPERHESRLRFELRARPEPVVEGWTRPHRLRLSWYGAAPPLRPGERWTLTARLRRPHGSSNPHGFDYERWLFERGIYATGYVRSAPAERVGQRRGLGSWVARTRDGLSRRITAALGDRPAAGLIKALTLGLRAEISARQWETLRRTGTAHLMAISGLHVGLAAAAGLLLAGGLWRCIPHACTWLPAPRVSLLAAAGSAFAYAALAGFSVPTQRALAMVLAVTAASWGARRLPASAVLALAALAVVVLDPSALLGAGFWLSFCAVCVLVYGMTGRIGPLGRWWTWGRAQLLIAVGLAPVTLLYFDRYPVGGLAANLMAVPWVSLVTVPLALAGTLLLAPVPELARGLLAAAAQSVELLWPALDLLAEHVPPWRPPARPSAPALAIALPGVLWLLAPRGVPGRWLGLLCLLPLLCPRPAPLPAGAVRMTLLDVGQGLAATIETRAHVLVYDTGPAYRSGFDAGRAAVVPYLRGEGWGRVDRVILSHADLDHTGGFPSLASELVVGEVLTGHAQAGAERCRRGQRWEWDGVRFEILHPGREEIWAGNDGSCVLRVASAHASILLTGDIERAAERHLRAHFGRRLAHDVLVVPHHGSATSSSRAFLESVDPHTALIPVGYGNRYGQPAPPVVQRLRRAASRVLRTDRSGAITVELLAQPRGGARWRIREHRTERRRYWHNVAAP